MEKTEKVIEVLNKLISVCNGAATSQPMSTLMNEYTEILKALEEEASIKDAIPLELMKYIDSAKHPDQLLHDRLTEWQNRQLQHQLKIASMKSIGEYL